MCTKCEYIMPKMYLHVASQQVPAFTPPCCSSFVNLQGTDSEDETSLSEDSGRKNPWRNLATGGDAYYLQRMQKQTC